MRPQRLDNLVGIQVRAVWSGGHLELGTITPNLAACNAESESTGSTLSGEIESAANSPPSNEHKSPLCHPGCHLSTSVI